MSEEVIDLADVDAVMERFDRELRRLIHADPTAEVIYHVTEGKRGVTKRRSQQERQFDRVMHLIRQAVELGNV